VQQAKAVDVYGIDVPKGALCVAATVPAAIGYIQFKEPIDRGLNWVNSISGKLGIATTAACVYATSVLNSEHSVVTGVPLGLLGAYFAKGLVDKWDCQREQAQLYKFQNDAVEKPIFTYVNPEKQKFMKLADWDAKKDDADFKQTAADAMTTDAGLAEKTIWVNRLKGCLHDLQERIITLNGSTGLMQKIKKQAKCEGDLTIDHIANLFVFPGSLKVDDYVQTGFGALMHGQIDSLFKVYKKSFWRKLVNGSDFNARVRLQWALLEKYATINFVLKEYICKAQNSSQQTIHFHPTYA